LEIPASSLAISAAGQMCLREDARYFGDGHDRQTIVKCRDAIRGEKFSMSSKLNNYSPLLEYLFNLGRQTGNAWIAQNGDALGQRSTMDVQQLLPGSIWDNI
jgi:hypothetical protein